MKTETTPSDTNHPHSPYGASCSKTWRTCPGAIQAIHKAKENGDIPENESSEYAEEGTIAHEWGEKCLKGEATFDTFPESMRGIVETYIEKSSDGPGTALQLADEMRVHVQQYVEWCLRSVESMETKFLAPGEAQSFVEKVVPLWYRGGDVGTCDFSVYIPQTALTICDFKYGAGIWNDAHENDQLAIYGLSFIYEMEAAGHDFPDDMPVALGIYQPRHYQFDGDPTAWRLTVRELKDIGIDIENDYKKAIAAEVVDLVPSEAGCMFCKVKFICEARGKTHFGGLPPAVNPMEDFDIETVNTPEKLEILKGQLTPTQIDLICTNASAITKFVKDVEKGELARLLAGGEVRPGGMKMVQGNAGKRQWHADKKEEATKLIRGKLSVDEAFKPRDLITAPQALNLLKGKDLSKRFTNKLETLYGKAEGKPTMVVATDKRPALSFEPDVENDFEDETETPASSKTVEVEVEVEVEAEAEIDIMGEI